MNGTCGSRTYCETSLFDCWMKYGVGYFKEHGELPTFNDLYAHVKDKSYKYSTLYQTYHKVEPQLRKYKLEYEKWQMVKNDHDGWTITLTDLCVWVAKWTKKEYIPWTGGLTWEEWKALPRKRIPCPLVKNFFHASSYSELMSMMMKTDRVIFERSN